MLDPHNFKQVHRSTIVNLKTVAGITRDDSGRGCESPEPMAAL